MQEELDYYKRKNLEIPAEGIKIKRNTGIFMTSWYMRGVNGYDEYGCNQFAVCVPEYR